MIDLKMRARLLVMFLIATVVSLPAQGKDVWDDLYREGIQLVRKQDWKQAEMKLMESAKLGPGSGRGVIRRGILGRDDYFPEFYLGVVFLNTGRASAAIPQFQLARTRGINPRDNEFRQLAELEKRAVELVEAAARNIPKGPDPKIQFKTLLDSAQKFLADSRYDDAESSARQARGLNVDNTAADALLQNISRSRASGRFQTQLRAARTLPELRRLLTEYESSGVALDELKRRIAEAEGVELRAAGERTGMVEYFTGNYTKALAVISEAEKRAPLSARGNFYRACILASLATRGKATNQTQLRDARRYYSLAAAQPDAFSKDLAYISPRILQLLKGS